MTVSRVLRNRGDVSGATRERVLEAARAHAPGADVYALEAEWRAWWVQTGRPRLSAPERAFLAWVKTRKG